MKSQLLLGIAVLLVTCSPEKPLPAGKSPPGPLPIRTFADVRVTPSNSAEITHEYQGLLQSRDGHTRWVVVNIVSAEPHDATFTVHYTANSPGYRRNDTTTVDAEGNFTVEHVQSHFARGADGRLVIESSAISGPPFCRLVQTRGGS